MMERNVSENVRVRWQLPDGHVEIDVSLPWPISTLKESVTLEIAPHEISIAREILVDAEAWLAKLNGR